MMLLGDVKRALFGVSVLCVCAAFGGCEGSIGDPRVSADSVTGSDGTSTGDTAISVPDGSSGDTSTTSNPPDISAGDADGSSGNDTSMVSDSSMPVDTNMVVDTNTDPCAGVNCGANSACQNGSCICDAGFTMQNGMCVSTDPCFGVTCGANSSCIAGTCECTPGFVSSNGMCLTPDPDNPALRTQQMVCDRWNADYDTTTNDIYDPLTGSANCDPGAINPVAHDDAMRRLNLFRWLSGLDPAGVDWNHQQMNQEFALMQALNGLPLSHSPGMSWPCYTADGATGAGSSNVSWGRSHPADSVDAYMRDSNTPSLGHRRWCLNPSLDDVGFGQYQTAGAMWSFGQNGSAYEPEFVAYPAPGPYPIDGVLGDWSFGRRSSFSSNFTVTITQLSDMSVLDTVASNRGNNYGWTHTIGIEMNDPVSVGETYRIEVVDGSESWTYETTLVDCN